MNCKGRLQVLIRLFMSGLTREDVYDIGLLHVGKISRESTATSYSVKKGQTGIAKDRFKMEPVFCILCSEADINFIKYQRFLRIP